MGSVFRATYTKALPGGAELFTRKGKRYARWEDAHGKRRTAPTTASDRGETRILLESRVYTAKYRDGSGVGGFHSQSPKHERSGPVLAQQLSFMTCRAPPRR